MSYYHANYERDGDRDNDVLVTYARRVYASTSIVGHGPSILVYGHGT